MKLTLKCKFHFHCIFIIYLVLSYINDSVGLTNKTLFLQDFYVMRPLFWLSTIAQESQQSASRGGVLAFYRIAACLSKKIDKLAKRNDCEDVGQWRQSISNHMYWCAATTPDGDGQKMKEKWKILPLHIQNIHTNTESQLHPQCGHGQLQGDAVDRLWLQPGRSCDSR